MYKEVLTNSDFEVNGYRLSLKNNKTDETYAYCEYEIFDEKGIANLINYFINQEINDIRDCDLSDKESDDMTNDEILTEYKDNFISIYNLKEKLSDELLIIHYIENSSIIKKLGTGIIDKFKEKHSSILLYSSVEAVSFWELNGFKEVHHDYYLWQR